MEEERVESDAMKEHCADLKRIRNAREKEGF